MHRPMLVLLAALALAGCGGAEPAATVAPTEPPTLAAVVEPTAEPTEGVDMAVANYVLWSGQTVGDAGDALKLVGAAMRPAGADPSLLSDPDWLTSTGRELGRMVAVANTIEEYADVPDEASAMHAEMLTYAGHLRTAAKLWAAGLDEKDLAKVTAASTIVKDDMPATLERVAAERDEIMPPRE